MEHPRRAACCARTWLAALSACLLVACGSSGGGGGTPAPPPSAFSGVYHLVWIGGTASSGRSMSSFTGTAVVDGAGSMTLDGSRNDDGTVTPVTGIPADYTEGPSGTLGLGGSGSPALEGGFSSDGACAVAATALVTAGPLVMVFLRRSGGFAPGSLDTAYHLSLFGLETSGPVVNGIVADFAFDGAGALGGGFLSNAEGTIDAFTTSGGYAMSPLGTLVFSASAGPEFRGGMIEGAAFGVIGGDLGGTPSNPAAGALVRAGAGLSDAVFEGAYWFAGMEYANAAGHFLSYTGTVTADGAGNLTVEGLTHDETSLDPFMGVATFDVAADGLLVVNRSAGEDLSGGIAADGRFAFVSGGLGAGSHPLFFVFCRKEAP